eukprot:scaffold3499_cov85-Skeletonema_menzelii.AAC.1
MGRPPPVSRVLSGGKSGKKSVLARYRPIFDRYPVASPCLPPPPLLVGLEWAVGSGPEGLEI